MEFDDKFLRDFAKKVGVKVNQVIRKTSYDIYNDITKNTAVGNADEWKGSAPSGYVGGRLRASLTINAETPKFYEAPENTDTKPKPKLGTLGNDPTVYIVNSLPYATPVLMDGWSKQTPKNMVEDAVQRAYTKLKTKYDQS